MTTITIDASLNENARDARQHKRWKRESALKKTQQEDVQYVALSVHSDLPDLEDADAFHGNLISMLEVAWQCHFKVALTPDVIWYTLLSGVAGRVKAAPDTYRSLFTRSAEKQTILTGTADVTKINLRQILTALNTLSPTNPGLFLPRFSTTTEASELAFLAAFCDAVSPYYNYMTTMCGIPAVKLLGTQEDWTRLHAAFIDMTAALAEIDGLYATWATTTAAPLLKRLSEQFTAPDAAFMGDMFRIERCGSGHLAPAAGWIVDLHIDAPEGHYKEVHDFPSHIARVQFTNAETRRQFDLCYGLLSSTKDADGFLVPEFRSVTHERAAD